MNFTFDWDWAGAAREFKFLELPEDVFVCRADEFREKFASPYIAA